MSTTNELKTTQRLSDVPEDAPVVLVVDDTRVNLMFVTTILEDHYRVRQAASGQQALELAAIKPHPDVILLDVMMPVMDGYEVLRRLRHNPDTREIPVIFITAMSGDQDEELGLALGAVDYMTKPLRPAILLARVRNHIELKHSRDILRSQNEILESRVAERTAALQREREQLAGLLAQQRELNRRLEDAQNQLLQSEKMASLGQLAAGVAHELNNPIGFVHSNLGTLEGYLKDIFEIAQACEVAACNASNQQDFAVIEALKKEKDFDFIQQDIFQLMSESKDGLNRVRKIVQDLKDFSRVGEAEWQTADVHKGLDSTLNIVWNELKYKCTVVKHYADNLPPVRCLPSQLNQVFMNLLVNAAHAIETKGEITISTRRVDDSHIQLRFTDNGQGIPPEHLKRIFEPFFTTKPVGKGTGLGLSIAWGIIGKHHGKIEVSSTVGSGTTFIITLPVHGPDEPVHIPAAVSPAPTFKPS